MEAVVCPLDAFFAMSFARWLHKTTMLEASQAILHWSRFRKAPCWPSWSTHIDSDNSGSLRNSTHPNAFAGLKIHHTWLWRHSCRHHDEPAWVNAMLELVEHTLLSGELSTPLEDAVQTALRAVTQVEWCVTRLATSLSAGWGPTLRAVFCLQQGWDRFNDWWTVNNMMLMGRSYYVLWRTGGAYHWPSCSLAHCNLIRWWNEMVSGSTRIFNTFAAESLEL